MNENKNKLKITIKEWLKLKQWEGVCIEITPKQLTPIQRKIFKEIRDAERRAREFFESDEFILKGI